MHCCRPGVLALVAAARQRTVLLAGAAAELCWPQPTQAAGRVDGAASGSTLTHHPAAKLQRSHFGGAGGGGWGGDEASKLM